MTKRRFDKKPIPFDKQIALLRSRGMTIEGDASAQQALSRLNYYRLSGYWYKYKRADGSYSNRASFERGVALYEYDRRLRLLLFDAIERVEVHLRTIFAYHMAHTHGAFSHEEPSNYRAGFTSVSAESGQHRSRFEDWLTRLHGDTKFSREVFVEHYKTTYLEFPTLPVWVAVELMSFGAVSKALQNLNRPDRKAIAAEFGFDRHLDDIFCSWIHTLSVVRNICAHHGRLWNRELPIKPKIPHKRQRLIPGRLPRNNRVYFILLILRHLTLDHPLADEWAQSVTALLEEGERSDFSMKSMGVPETWREHEYWSLPATKP